MTTIATAKASALNAVLQMSEDATYDDILEAIKFRAVVDEGLRQADCGETVTHDEVRRSLARWLT